MRQQLDEIERVKCIPFQRNWVRESDPHSPDTRTAVAPVCEHRSGRRDGQELPFNVNSLAGFAYEIDPFSSPKFGGYGFSITAASRSSRRRGPGVSDLEIIAKNPLLINFSFHTVVHRGLLCHFPKSRTLLHLQVMALTGHRPPQS